MHRRISRLAVAAVVLLAGLDIGASDAVARTKTLTVGTLTLHRCEIEGHTVTAYCGSIKVPLNYHTAKDGEIAAGFAWMPATAPLAGPGVPPTIVAEEGGPGYPATGSAGDYQVMLGRSILATHNLLVVDERGTGNSTLIDCKPLEAIHVVTTTRPFRRDVRTCGRSLDHQFRKPGGGYVHASDLFTTANATRDMARVLNALQIVQVDLYGDSYGTYFAQSFMSHFPKRLRSVTLDSAYEARGLDPWYRTTVTTARHAFDLACRRSPACLAAAPGRSWHRISRLARSLRAHPFSGRAPGVDATRVGVRMNVNALVNIVNDAGYDADPYRQLDAAARAYLRHGDRLPLLRLWAQDIGYDFSDYNASPHYFSDGQYIAVACSDYPQLFGMRDSMRLRRLVFGRQVQHYPAHAFAPFTAQEWVGVNPFTETYHACTDWPRRRHRADPPVVPRTPMDATNVPVLILNGELDSLTPAAGGAHLHRQIGAASRHVVTANTVHLVAVDNSRPCGQRIVRAFMTDPSTLQTLDTSCADKVPPIRTVGSYPRTVRQATPAHGKAPIALRRLAAIALAAAGDVAHRYNYVDGNRDLGLRGGRVHYGPLKYGVSVRGRLHKVRWTSDSQVSGAIGFLATATSGAANVTIRSRGHRPVKLHVAWRGRHGYIKVAGHGRPLLHAPAP